MATNKELFQECCDGFGFEEIEQTADGTYCDGCMVVHKRPTKMYKGGRDDNDVLCKFQVIRLYNPNED